MKKLWSFVTPGRPMTAVARSNPAGHEAPDAAAMALDPGQKIAE